MKKNLIMLAFLCLALPMVANSGNDENDTNTIYPVEQLAVTGNIDMA